MEWESHGAQGALVCRVLRTSRQVRSCDRALSALVAKWHAMRARACAPAPTVRALAETRQGQLSSDQRHPVAPQLMLMSPQGGLSLLYDPPALRPCMQLMLRGPSSVRRPVAPPQLMLTGPHSCITPACPSCPVDCPCVQLMLRWSSLDVAQKHTALALQSLL